MRAAQSHQLCPALCDSMDYSLPGSSVHGIFQARILKWAAMPSSSEVSRHRDGTCVPYVFMSPALAGGFFTTSATWEALFNLGYCFLYTCFVYQCLSDVLQRFSPGL